MVADCHIHYDPRMFSAAEDARRGEVPLRQRRPLRPSGRGGGLRLRPHQGPGGSLTLPPGGREKMFRANFEAVIKR